MRLSLSVQLFLSLLFFSSFQQFSFAQYDDILNDKSVTWAAEFSSDMSLNISPERSQELSTLLKFYNANLNFEEANKNDFVKSWLYKNALEGNYDCYKDPSLTQRLSLKDITTLTSTIDTVTTFDPDSYEEQIMIIRNDLNPKKIRSLRMNQLIYYNSKTENFETRLLSFAFLYFNEKGESTPVFWVKMNESFPTSFNINSNDVVWGALIFSKSSPLNMNFIQEVKNTANFKLQKALHDQAIGGKKVIESPMGYGSDTPLSSFEVENIYTSVDTVVTFDPGTYEEQIRIIKNDFDPLKVSEFRLVQEWYYNRKSRKLMNRLRAIAPLVWAKDDNGVPRFSKPMYYLRVD